ncbi:zinc-dependent metalloprotease [Nesterenkonia marinintestina]|uniref:zinc-dependent metalloprotease n=1 Tax=Nesterenkonia marinintestina TaxID=2979865 RepID=UPI0021BE15A7|nr:zinc-dependent metalloprotease [Nesterenkonia sp. GX14115]
MMRTAEPTTEDTTEEATEEAEGHTGLTEEQAADLLINWEVVEHAARALVPPGPKLSAREAAVEVAALRAAALASVDHVHRITGIPAAAGLGADPEDTLVVDRPTWSRANARSFRRILAPSLKAALERRPDMLREGSSSQVFGSALTGTEMGGILAFLSANVLGQFDPFAPGAREGVRGQLMLVAPNMVEVRRQLNLEPDDFRLWVCLHEQTHRVQFAAAPWLPEHLMGLMETVSTTTLGAGDVLGERLREAFSQLKEEMRDTRGSSRSERRAQKRAAREQRRDADGDVVPPRNRVVEVIATDEGREAFSRATAVMSLLEGHANHVMDHVDSSIVSSVKTIRRRFEARAKNRGIMERLVRRMLQLDVKARQYVDGQRFVDHVVAQIGMEGFNRIWESPETLPTEHELHNPDRWIARVGVTPTSA